MQSILAGVRRLLDTTLAQLEAFTGTEDRARMVNHDLWNALDQVATPRERADMMCEALIRRGVSEPLWRDFITQLQLAYNLLDRIEKILMTVAQKNVDLGSLLKNDWNVDENDELLHRGMGTVATFHAKLPSQRRQPFVHYLVDSVTPGRGIYLGCDPQGQCQFQPVTAQSAFTVPMGWCG